MGGLVCNSVFYPGRILQTWNLTGHNRVGEKFLSMAFNTN